MVLENFPYPLSFSKVFCNFASAFGESTETLPPIFFGVVTDSSVVFFVMTAHTFAEKHMREQLYLKYGTMPNNIAVTLP